jgi:hypothetical protein
MVFLVQSRVKTGAVISDRTMQYGVEYKPFGALYYLSIVRYSWQELSKVGRISIQVKGY